MSETTTTVPMDDKALFDAALSDPTPEAPVAEAPAQEAQPEPEKAGQPRDEHGRFAPKAEAPEAPAAEAAEPQPAKAQDAPAPADVIPPWRLREEAEARRSAENRVQQLQAKLQQLERPPEPIDPYADPEKFRDHGVRQAIDPLFRQLQDQREYFSRRLAISTHGQETVQEAYKWLEQAAQAGDPKAGPLLARVMQSPDPFEDVVAAYKQERAMKTINGDPEKWFEQELERRKADPAFAAKHFGQQQKQPGAEQQTNVVRVPPSLSRQTGVVVNGTGGDMSDRSLYEFATR